MEGKAIVFGSDIDTDQIIGAHHLTLPTIDDMAKYTFENYTNFSKHFVCGDIIVGANNFGCGSSREQAPAVLKKRGVGAIVAKSFARIFYRNAINIGIPLIECEGAVMIDMGDELEVKGDVLLNHTKGQQYSIHPYPSSIQNIFDCGGLVSYIQKSKESGD